MNFLERRKIYLETCMDETPDPAKQVKLGSEYERLTRLIQEEQSTDEFAADWELLKDVIGKSDTDI